MKLLIGYDGSESADAALADLRLSGLPIFVGARNFTSAFERFPLGSVSTASVTSAPCSVEVVR